MDSLKIYNLTDHWFPDKIGGSCLYAYQLHRLLSKQVDIETITLAGDKTPLEKNMVVRKWLCKANILKNRKIIRGLWSKNADAIWLVHSPWFFLHLFFALGFKIRNNVIAVYHGPWYREYFHSASSKSRFIAKIAFSLLRYLIELVYCVYIKKFIFLSEQMFRECSDYLPIFKAKVDVIPMWSEKKQWDHPIPSNDGYVISTFRRLEPRMGLQDLISSLPRLDIRDFTLNICGDGPYKNELKNLIKSMSLPEGTVQLLGWVSEEEKRRLLKESDAIIIPSRSMEGFSLLALEALECGTPVLLTEAVGFYEYVKELDQDFVKAIHLKDSRVEIREFLSKGRNRKGLDCIRHQFASETIRQQLLAVLASRKKSIPTWRFGQARISGQAQRC